MIDYRDGKWLYNDKEVLSYEEDFSKGMVARLDEIDNATVEYLSILAGKKLNKNDFAVAEIVGEVSEFACNTLLVKGGYNACYPYKSNDGESPIVRLCTHCDECDIYERGECKYKNEMYKTDIFMAEIPIDVIKEAYQKSDIVMSELIRNNFREISLEEIRELLDWSGDSEFVRAEDLYDEINQKEE